MAKNSAIEWTHHTFNPWWGCKKVSPACKNCYAEAWAKRTGQRIWGADSDRRFFGEAHWKEPLRWNNEAATNGARARVFCASMADVFERKAILNSVRRQLWDLIEQTPHLDWLLLTKRPHNITRMTPWGSHWPQNVWVGTSVENQTLAEIRLPHLLAVPASVRFLSCEPLLGPLDLSPWFSRSGFNPIDWVIVGGESGGKSRPMHPDWAVALLQQCQQANTPFHFKQWGHWVPSDLIEKSRTDSWVTLTNERPVQMVAAGKKLAGRVLQGATWNSLPVLSNR